MEAKNVTREEAVTKETMFSQIPVLPRERFITWGGNFSLTIAAWIASWLFVTAAWTGMLVPVPIALAVIAAGCGIPLFIVAILSVWSSRYGLDQGIYAKITFGTLGGVIALIILIIPFWGWSAIPTVMFGRIMQSLGEYWGMAGGWTNPVVWGLVCLGVGVFLSYVGPRWQQKVFRIAAVAMITLMIAMTIRFVAVYGMSNIMAAVPTGFGYAEHPMQNILLAFEINIGAGFSWLLTQSEWSRHCKSERVAYWPNALIWGPLTFLFMFPGVMLGTLAGMGDPVEAILLLGGGWTVAYLVLMAIANPSSVVLIWYAASLTFKTLFRRLSWKLAMLTPLPATLIYSFWVYDWYGMYVTWIAVIYGCIAGVWALDAVLKKHRASLKDAFDSSKTSAYHYWKGINWPAFGAVAIGFGISVAIYNPMTMGITHWPVFQVMGSGLLGCLSSAASYYVLYRIFLKPKMIGFPETPALDRTERTVGEGGL